MQVAVASAIHEARASPLVTGSALPYFAQMSSASALRTPSVSNASTADEYRYRTSSMSNRSCRAWMSGPPATLWFAALTTLSPPTESPTELTSIQRRRGAEECQAGYSDSPPSTGTAAPVTGAVVASPSQVMVEATPSGLSSRSIGCCEEN